MATIPLGNFGNVMPQAQPGRVLDTGAGHVAQAAGQLGQVGQQVAVKQLNEEQKIQDEKDEYFFSTQAAKYGAEYTDVVTDALQLVTRTEAPGGEKLITNQDIFKIDDEVILNYYGFDKSGHSAQSIADNAFKLKEQLANKYMNHIYIETNAAVLEVGARETTMMGLNSERGTMTNELTRFFMQFKQFPLTMIVRQWTRAMAQGTPQEKFLYLAKLFSYTTIAGGIVAQIQNLTQGKNLEDPTTMDFFFKSIVKGGAMSFMR